MKAAPVAFKGVVDSDDFVKFLVENNARDGKELGGPKHPMNSPLAPLKELEDSPPNNSFYSNTYWGLKQDEALEALD